MPIQKGVVAALLVVVALVVGASPSVAASEDTSDPKSDVLSGSYLSDSPPQRREQARRIGDIVRTQVTFGSELVVTTKFRSLAAGSVEQNFSWFIRTSQGRVPWFAQLTVARGSGAESFFIVNPVANRPRCAKAELDRRARLVTLSIPADCLGSPSWVQVASGATFAVEPSRVYYDDARRAGDVRRGWKFGPKLAGSTAASRTSAAPGSASRRS